MARQSPILIAGPTRCGTTMIAGLLHFHGVWIGKARVTAYPQTNSLLGTENTEIKQFLKKWAGDGAGDFRQKLMKMVKTDGPWLLKTVQILHKADRFLDAFPSATWLLPTRPFDDIVESQMRHPGMPGSREARARKVRWCQERQNMVAERANKVLRVDAHAMAKGSEEVAREMIEFCGFTFDRGIWAGWIDPGMWHGRQAAPDRPEDNPRA